MYATGNTDGEGYLLAQLRQKYPENPSLALYEAEKTCPKPRLGVCHQNIG